MKSKAFTLAEVLITIGIIGIVAAFTLPTLVHKLRNAILEKQFKHYVALINQAILLMKNELDVDSVQSFCAERNNENACKEAFGKSFSTFLTDRMPVDRTGEIQNFTGTNYVILDSCSYTVNHTTKMNNGMYLGFGYPCVPYFQISIDVNGARKPNQLGHDVFLFRIENNSLASYNIFKISEEDVENRYANGDFSNENSYNFYGNPCNLTSTRQGNGVGCTYYALRDECPDGSGRRYFECLK
jgi:prepilin-type N-terminal cleavage/methylation domain-containing protein